MKNGVTVIGLGSMGAAIAALLIRRGRQVTVWNRTSARAEDLAGQGASIAETPAAAVRANPLVVMCVYDYRAAEAILGASGVAEAMAGRTLVQLTTGSPDDARKAMEWCRQYGVRYVEGAIQAAPSQMGQSDTPLLLSGEQATYRTVEPVLKDLAGNLLYLGDRIEAAATMDLATLSYVYGAMTGFLHGARIAEAEGLDVAQYGRIVNVISPSFGAFFQHEGKVIRSGDFTVSESPLRISVEATQRILEASKEAGINVEFPAFVADLLKRADAAGLGNEELAALIKVLRG